MIKLNIQQFGGRGASSGSKGSAGAGGSFFGEEKGGFTKDGTRYFAGDTVTIDGKEYTVSSVPRTGSGKTMTVMAEGGKEIKVTQSDNIKLKTRGQGGQSLFAKQRVNVLRGADDRTNFNGRTVAMYNKAPKGFVKINTATTAPKGYEWYNNKKSLFSDEYIHILVKEKRR